MVSFEKVCLKEEFITAIGLCNLLFPTTQIKKEEFAMKNISNELS